MRIMKGKIRLQRFRTLTGSPPDHTVGQENSGSSPLIKEKLPRPSGGGHTSAPPPQISATVSNVSDKSYATPRTLLEMSAGRIRLTDFVRSDCIKLAVSLKP